jgi:hypothetical protein
VAAGGQALAAAGVTTHDLGVDILRSGTAEAIAATCRRLGVRYRHE